MAQLFAKVLSITDLPEVLEVKDAAGVITQAAIPAARTYRMSIKANSKFATSSIYWLTMAHSEGKYDVGENEVLDSEMFYATEKLSKNGETIKILKSKNVQLL